jgi:uncharacterized protein with PQ loop repeat
MNNNFTENFIGSIAMIFCIIYFISPIYEISKLIKKQIKTNVMPYLIYFCTILNTETSVLYGILVKSWPFYICNGVGCVLNIIYLIIFILNCKKTPIKKEYLILMLLTLVFGSFFGFLFLVKNLNVCGTISSFLNTFMIFAPFQKVSDSFKYKDNKFIPVSITLFLFLSCLFFMIYGLMKDLDLYITVPNILGVLFCCSQIFIWFYFEIKNKENNENNNFEEEKKNFIEK